MAPYRLCKNSNKSYNMRIACASSVRVLHETINVALAALTLAPHASLQEAKREKKRQKREGHGRSRSASDSDREEAAGLRHTQGLANGGSRERSWLASHIMVKIIDKHLKGGRSAGCVSADHL